MCVDGCIDWAHSQNQHRCLFPTLCSVGVRVCSVVYGISHRTYRTIGYTGYYKTLEYRFESLGEILDLVG